MNKNIDYRIEKTREVIRTALKIDKMSPDKLKRFKQFILMFEIKNESWVKDEVIKMINERMDINHDEKK